MFEIKVLSKEDIRKVMDLSRVIKDVESVYRLKSRGETVVWPTVFYEFDPGKADMDIKSGLLKSAGVFGHKTVTWFGANKELGIPELTGVIVIYDAGTGIPLGVLDASYITGIRTGAAGAIGAKYLAREDSKNLLLLGTGMQAVYQIAAMLTLWKGVETVRVANVVHPEKAVSFAAGIREKMKREFGIPCDHVRFEAVGHLEKAVSDSDIIITVTPSRKPMIRKEWVRAGTHFSCIGADMCGKEEIDPEIFRDAKIYVDDKTHCMETGEIEIPLKTNVIGEDCVCGEIGDLLEGKIPGRGSEEEITVFDAAGMALLDIAVAKTAMDLADEKNLGSSVNF